MFYITSNYLFSITELFTKVIYIIIVILHAIEAVTSSLSMQLICLYMGSVERDSPNCMNVLVQNVLHTAALINM